MHAPSVEIRRVATDDEALVRRSAALFDRPLIAAATSAFLAAGGHHLLIALVGGEPAGFVSGVETIHPDKGTEMLLYELGVGEPFRRRGIGVALVEALVALARARGCYGMWVLTAPDNEAALSTYRRAGARATPDTLMLEWRFEP